VICDLLQDSVTTVRFAFPMQSAKKQSLAYARYNDVCTYLHTLCKYLCKYICGKSARYVPFSPPHHEP